MLTLSRAPVSETVYHWNKIWRRKKYILWVWWEWKYHLYDTIHDDNEKYHLYVPIQSQQTHDCQFFPVMCTCTLYISMYCSQDVRQCGSESITFQCSENVNICLNLSSTLTKPYPTINKGKKINKQEGPLPVCEAVQFSWRVWLLLWGKN